MKFKNINFAKTRLLVAVLAMLIGGAHIPIASAQLPAKAGAVLILPNHAPENFTQVRPDVPKRSKKFLLPWPISMWATEERMPSLMAASSEESLLHGCSGS